MCRLARSGELRVRTLRDTLPDMFGYHRTDPDRAARDAIRARLHQLESRRRARRSTVDARWLRFRLARSSCMGLRARLGVCSPVAHA